MAPLKAGLDRSFCRGLRLSRQRRLHGLAVALYAVRQRWAGRAPAADRLVGPVGACWPSPGRSLTVQGPAFASQRLGLVAGRHNKLMVHGHRKFSLMLA